MNLTQLKYFIALAETLNFSQVARDFYVAQTSVSYSIQTLEHELGIQLFERSTKSTRLTPGGHLFYPKARAAVELLARGQKEAMAAMEITTIMIGCSRLCSGKRFYGLIHDLQENNPKIQILLTASEPEIDMFGDLSAGKIDIAVYLTNPFSQKPQCGQYTTRQFPINVPRKIIVSKAHPYAQHKEGLPAESLRLCQRITYGDLENILLRTPSADESIQSVFRPLIAKDFHSLIDMVGAGLGISCLPIIDDLETESVCTIPCLEAQAPEHFVTLAITYVQNNPSPYIPQVAETITQSILQSLKMDGY